MANRIVLEGHSINKNFINKADAERDYGFVLYQGGIVPGNQLRVVNIGGVDVEACCGTHHDNTNQVGFIKILRTKRISDGIVRLYFVAYEKSMKEIAEDTKVINQLCTLWGIERNNIYDTASRFFTDVKKLANKTKNQSSKLIDYQMKAILNNPEVKAGFIKSDEENCQLYFSTIPGFANDLVKNKKGVIYFNEGFIYALFGDKSLIKNDEFKAFCEGMKSDANAKFKYNCQEQINLGKKNKIKDIYLITCFTNVKVPALIEKFKQLGYTEVN